MTPEPDPFDRLRVQLRSAADRRAGVSPHPARSTPARGRRLVGRLSGRSTLVALVGVGVVASAATATVIATSDTPSAPSAGPLTIPATGAAPGGGPPARYAVTMRPDLRVGEVGWCTTLSVRASTRFDSSGGVGCGPAATDAYPIIAAGTSTVAQGTMTYAIVDQRVAALRPGDGRRVAPRPGPDVPNGWKAIVLLPDGSRGGAAPLRPAPAVQDDAYAGTDGGPVAVGPRADRHVRPQASRSTDGPAPADGPCRIVVGGRSTVRASRTLLTAPEPRPAVNGRAFLSCSASLVRRPDGHVTVTVLLDAERPGAVPPAELPGFRPLEGAPGIVATAPGTIGEPPAYARRLPDGWLVVEPGDPHELTDRRAHGGAVDLRAALADAEVAAP